MQVAERSKFISNHLTAGAYCKAVQTAVKNSLVMLTIVDTGGGAWGVECVLGSDVNS